MTLREAFDEALNTDVSEGLAYVEHLATVAFFTICGFVVFVSASWALGKLTKKLMKKRKRLRQPRNAYSR